MKVSNDIAAPAMNAGDAKSTDTIDAGEFAALLAGIAGLQGMVPQIDLTAAAAPGAATQTATPATQLPALVLALASMPNIDLNALAQLAGAANQAAAAAGASPETITVEVLSATVGELAGDTPGPLVATPAAPNGADVKKADATLPTVTAAAVDAPVVLVAAGAGAGTDANAAQADQQSSPNGTGPKTAAPLGPVVAKAETAKVETHTMPTADAAPVVVAPTVQDVRPNEPAKMIVPPTRIDTVAVAAARASADASRPIRLTVRLDPPNLGELRVELTARGGQVTVRLEPTNPTAAPQLSSQRAAVADALERTGFQLSGFDIANPEQQQQQQGFAQRRNATRTAAVEEIEADDEPATDGLRI